MQGRRNWRDDDNDLRRPREADEKQVCARGIALLHSLSMTKSDQRCTCVSFALVRCSASRVLPQFDPKSKRVESNTFDELGKTKSSAKESSRAGWMGGLWGGSAVDNDSSDDDDAKPESKRRVTIGGYASDGSSDYEGAASSAFGRAGQWGSFARSMSADLRKASSQLPEGVEIVGGDGTFEEQEDGDAAFVVPEGAHVKVTLPGMSPWQLEEDGRLHKYSLLVAVKLDRLPYAGAARARRLTLLHRHICSAHRIRPSFFAMLSFRLRLHAF